MVYLYFFSPDLDTSVSNSYAWHVRSGGDVVNYGDHVTYSYGRRSPDTVNSNFAWLVSPSGNVNYDNHTVRGSYGHLTR